MSVASWDLADLICHEFGGAVASCAATDNGGALCMDVDWLTSPCVAEIDVSACTDEACAHSGDTTGGCSSAGNLGPDAFYRLSLSSASSELCESGHIEINTCGGSYDTALSVFALDGTQQY